MSYAEKLVESSFGTYDEVLRFIRWYEKAEFVSEWDKTRNDQANELVDLHEKECRA